VDAAIPPGRVVCRALGCLCAAQVVSGMEAARSWPGLLRGTCEPVTSARWSAGGWPWEGAPQAVEAARR
jgi:hypothetical protein